LIFTNCIICFFIRYGLVIVMLILEFETKTITGSYGFYFEPTNSQLECTTTRWRTENAFLWVNSFLAFSCGQNKFYSNIFSYKKNFLFKKTFQLESEFCKMIKLLLFCMLCNSVFSYSSGLNNFEGKK
jgi:hypothetical protein